MHDIHIIDVVIVIFYFLICIKVGLHQSKSIKTLKEYTLGGRNFPDIVLSQLFSRLI
ncbi:MAG: hypothetical protein MRQ09_01485 [Candidatus Midichloria sp.]|nr:hypothetical protein [Candidatus Midichloria sp.]